MSALHADGGERHPNVAIAPGDPAYILFTSGSTGWPKAVANSHAGIINRLAWMQDAFGLEVGERVLQKTPFTFDVSVWELFWPTLAGGTVCTVPPGAHRDANVLYATLRDEAISTVHFVPSAFSAFLRSRASFELPALRRMLLSGECLEASLVSRAFELLDAELHNLYGPTEAAIDVTHWRCERGDARDVVPIGRPIANTQIHVLDQADQAVPTGVPGEIVIAGAGVATGYIRRPELTRSRFRPAPLDPTGRQRAYWTGDRGRWTREGVLEFLGRIDDQVKIAGVRIELGEVAAALREELGVVDAAVSMRGEGFERALVAHVVEGAQPLPPLAEVRRRLAERLPSVMIPVAVVALDQLPLLANGKLDRNALPAPERSGLAMGVALAPASDTERALAELWQAVIGADAHFGVTDNFFDAGGASAQLMALQIEISRRLGVMIPIVRLFEASTIREQAALISPSESDADTGAPSGDKRGPERLASLVRLRSRRVDVER